MRTSKTNKIGLVLFALGVALNVVSVDAEALVRKPAVNLDGNFRQLRKRGNKNKKPEFVECRQAPFVPEDRRPDKSQLKYATYNVEFLFLTGFGSLDCPGSGCKWKDLEMAQKHVKQVAANVRDLNADIVQLDEVEDCTALHAVIRELEALGDNTYRPYLVRGRDTSTGQNVALLTRVDPMVDLTRDDGAVSLPVPESTCPAPSRPKRKTLTKHLVATFNVTGFAKPITVVGAHFLARPTDERRCVDREGQAYIVAQLAQAAIQEGNHVIISGDLNDFSATVPDRNNNAPISNVLGILRGDSFVEVASKVEQSSRFTQWWDRNRDCEYEMHEVSSLDHVLVSSSLEASLVDVAFGGDQFGLSCTGFGSDHLPIAITLKESA